MLISKFNELLNAELTELITSNSDDDRTKTHKNPQLNKGYALLIWFLKFYGQKPLYRTYITDGMDDSSCDIIFDNKTVMNEEIFYVIQSKYVAFDAAEKRTDAFPRLDKKEFGYALTDFTAILNGTRKLGKNEIFNRKCEALTQHLAKNGKAKFIFFTLAMMNDEIEAALNSFNKANAPKSSLEVIDIQRIRRDYIEFKYKKIFTSNPLEYQYSPEEANFFLEIERSKEVKRDIFEYKGRSKAAVVLLKPKTVHKLFERYKFSLFFKNVRNPLHESNYNAKIVDTLLTKPDSFWFFNNGITGITKILPEIGVHAKQIELEGLQIINGAQTVYSIYQAYEQASRVKRKAMDEFAHVMLRLIGSSDDEFNLQITRFTNSQNPLGDRDFWANDVVQQRLQNESFATNVWYEKRAGEFRLNEQELNYLGIKILSNEESAKLYSIFHLQNPFTYLVTKLIFIGHKENPDGLYESIFNRDTKYEAIYVAYYVNKWLLSVLPEDLIERSMHEHLHSWILAISKVVMQKYFNLIYANAIGKDFNLTTHLHKVAKEAKKEGVLELLRLLKYSTELIHRQFTGELDWNPQNWIEDSQAYRLFQEHVALEYLDIAAIQAINVEI
ncbi:MAG: hypothetical protein RIS64_2702 [Bacteroidota bacterium]|jgi:hypothetical protein